MNSDFNESGIIANYGWQQGSIFDPKDLDLDVLSVAGQHLEENELLINRKHNIYANTLISFTNVMLLITFMYVI